MWGDAKGDRGGDTWRYRRRHTEGDTEGDIDGDALWKEALLARGLQPMDKPMLEEVRPWRDCGLWRNPHQSRAIRARMRRSNRKKPLCADPKLLCHPLPLWRDWELSRLALNLGKRVGKFFPCVCLIVCFLCFSIPKSIIESLCWWAINSIQLNSEARLFCPNRTGEAVFSWGSGREQRSWQHCYKSFMPFALGRRSLCFWSHPWYPCGPLRRPAVEWELILPG